MHYLPYAAMQYLGTTLGELQVVGSSVGLVAQRR
jgi:hypothetical protein